MARKTKKVTISSNDRDNGKSFLITEMPADQAESWALRLLFALMNTGVDIPDSAMDAPTMALATIGIQALGKLPYKEAKPLLDEMFECVQFLPPNTKIAPIDVGSGENSQIEEVITRMKLRVEVFELHVGFSLPVSAWTSGSKVNPSQVDSLSTVTSQPS